MTRETTKGENHGRYFESTHHGRRGATGYSGVTFMAPAIPGALAMVNAEALKPENMKRYFEMKGDLDDIGSWPSCLVEAVIKKTYAVLSSRPQCLS